MELVVPQKYIIHSTTACLFTFIVRLQRFVFLLLLLAFSVFVFLCFKIYIFYSSKLDSFWVFCWFFFGEQICKRFIAEVSTEINLLAENWKYILVGLIFQVCILFPSVGSFFPLITMHLGWLLFRWSWSCAHFF